MKQEILKVEEAIAFTKQVFESELMQQLKLTKVSAPIAVLSGTGINDDLNGYERTVDFPVKQLKDQRAVVVNSLAKWKRIRLQELEVEEDKGIVTDMRALRPDEEYSSIHSIYVDQWDWEKRISPHSRSIDFLKSEVRKIYQALRRTEFRVAEVYDDIKPLLPSEITFIHAEQLLQMYPELKPKEREREIVKHYGAVFIIGIGGKLSNGEPHDGRAPDYDDWTTMSDAGFAGLNGDILVWHPVLQDSFELSSMGIRVDKMALLRQLDEASAFDRKSLLFHKLLLEDKLPECIGGGIGQSRVCMYILRKKHIGEVQVGVWDDAVKASEKEKGVVLL
jgi:aspartate--ammonia ligase